jgi:Bacterial regulatory proteins, tetR family
LGVSREQAAENRRAIIAAATQLFRERGVNAVGLSELMNHAGFTQGAGDSPRVGAEAQSYFAGGLDDQITILAGLIAEHGSIAETGERRTLRERAISLHCEMVGALVLSRSVAQAAPAFSNEILENVQRDVTASLNLLSSRTSNKGKKRQGGPVR